VNILLHICCAPCSLYTIDKLKQDGHDVQGFFYNPNIYPSAEYKLRRQAVADMAKRLNVDVTYKDDNARAIQELPKQKPSRCNGCWRMRLRETLKTAKQESFDAFSTTLLISPYQNHDEIRVIGNELGKEKRIDFYYDDFRAGFRKSQEMAKEQGVYRQKYCGCSFSMEERDLKK